MDSSYYVVTTNRGVLLPVQYCSWCPRALPLTLLPLDGMKEKCNCYFCLDFSVVMGFHIYGECCLLAAGSVVERQIDIRYSERIPITNQLESRTGGSSCEECYGDCLGGVRCLRTLGSVVERQIDTRYSERIPIQNQTQICGTSGEGKKVVSNAVFARMRRMAVGKTVVQKEDQKEVYGLEEQSADVGIADLFKWQYSQARKICYHVQAEGVLAKVEAVMRAQQLQANILKRSGNLLAKAKFFGNRETSRRPVRKLYMPKSKIDVVRNPDTGPKRTNFTHLIKPDFAYVDLEALEDPFWADVLLPTESKIERAKLSSTLRRNHDWYVFKQLAKMSITALRTLCVNNCEHIKHGLFDKQRIVVEDVGYVNDKKGPTPKKIRKSVLRKQGVVCEIEVGNKKKSEEIIVTTDVQRRRLFSILRAKIKKYRYLLAQEQREVLHTVLDCYDISREAKKDAFVKVDKTFYHEGDGEIVPPMRRQEVERVYRESGVGCDMSDWCKITRHCLTNKTQVVPYVAPVMFDLYAYNMSSSAYKRALEVTDSLIEETANRIATNLELVGIDLGRHALVEESELEYNSNDSVHYSEIDKVKVYEGIESGSTEDVYDYNERMAELEAERYAVYDFVVEDSRRKLQEQALVQFFPTSTSDVIEETLVRGAVAVEGMAFEIVQALRSFNTMIDGLRAGVVKQFVADQKSFYATCLDVTNQVVVLITQVWISTTPMQALLSAYAFVTRYVSLTDIFSKLKDSVFLLVQLLYGKHTESSEVDKIELKEQSYDWLEPEYWGTHDLERKIIKWGRLATSVNHMMRLADNVAKFIMNSLMPPETPLHALSSQYPDIYNWMMKIDEINILGGVDKVARDVAISISAQTLHTTGKVLLKELYSSNAATKDMKECMLKYLIMAKELSAAATLSTTGVRARPVFLWLGGAPGTGKSALLNALVRALCERKNLDCAQQQSFAVTPKSDYWDGYHSQYVCTVDDIFQSDDKADRRLQALDIIHAAGDTAYPLNMAGVEGKGKFFFESRVIMATSNIKSTNQLGLTDESAFLRRIDYRVEVSVKPEFATDGRIDQRKVDLAYGEANSYNVNILRFDLMDKAGLACVGELTYAQLVDHIDALVDARACMARNQCGVVDGPPLADTLAEELVEDMLVPIQEAILNDQVQQVDYLGEAQLARVKVVAAGVQILKRASETLSETYNANKLIINSALAVLVTACASFIALKSIGGGSTQHKPMEDCLVASPIKRPVVLEGLIPSGDVKTRAITKHRFVSREPVVPVAQVITCEAAVSPVHEFSVLVGNKQVPCIDLQEQDGGSHHIEDVQLAEVFEQGSPDSETSQLIDTYCTRQLFRFFVYETRERKKVIVQAHLLFVHGLAAVVPYHAAIHFHRGEVMDLYCSGNKPKYSLSMDAFEVAKVSPALDLAVILFGKKSGVGRYRSIINKFITSGDLNRDMQVASLVVRLPPQTATGFGQLMLQTSRYVHTESMENYSVNEKSLLMTTGFRYPDLVTSVGFCGAPLVLYNPACVGKIMGFHYLGITDELGGWSTIVTQERVLALLEGLDCDSDLKVKPPVDDSMDSVELAEQAGFDFLGRVAPDLRAYQNGVSKIRKSPFFEAFGKAKTAPAVLCITNGVDPRMRAVQKNFGAVRTIPIAMMQEIEDFMYHWLSAKKGKRKLGLLSLVEAFNGKPGTHIRPLTLDTSSGWPYNKQRPGTKKAWVTVDADNHVVSVDKKLLNDIKERIRLAKERKNVPAVFCDTMKDERVSVAAVEACKTRLFANGPVDYTVAFRIYFADLCEFVQTQRLDMECAIGVNPASNEWGVLLARLNEIEGDNFIAGDFKNYDGSIPPQFMQAVGSLVNRLYDDGEVNANVRDVLMYNIYNSIHLNGADVYQVFKANPSGNPFTTVMNSLVNTMLMLYAWMRMGYSLADYHRFVRAINYGDDNVLKVSPHCPKFTMKTIAVALQDLDIVYTPAKKNDVNYDYLPLEEVTFLKRHFVYDESIAYWQAPLEEDSFVESLYWYTDGMPVWDAMESISDSFLLEAVAHGRAYYNDSCTRIRELWASHGKLYANAFRPWDEHISRMFPI